MFFIFQKYPEHLAWCPSIVHILTDGKMKRQNERKYVQLGHSRPEFESRTRVRIPERSFRLVFPTHMFHPRIIISFYSTGFVARPRCLPAAGGAACERRSDHLEQYFCNKTLWFAPVLCFYKSTATHKAKPHSTIVRVMDIWII